MWIDLRPQLKGAALKTLNSTIAQHNGHFHLKLVQYFCKDSDTHKIYTGCNYLSLMKGLQYFVV